MRRQIYHADAERKKLLASLTPLTPDGVVTINEHKLNEVDHKGTSPGQIALTCFAELIPLFSEGRDGRMGLPFLTGRMMSEVLTGLHVARVKENQEWIFLSMCAAEYVLRELDCMKHCVFEHLSVQSALLQTFAKGVTSYLSADGTGEGLVVHIGYRDRVLEGTCARKVVLSLDDSEVIHIYASDKAALLSDKVKHLHHMFKYEPLLSGAHYIPHVWTVSFCKQKSASARSIPSLCPFEVNEFNFLVDDDDESK